MRESRIVMAFVIAIILVALAAVVTSFQVQGRIDDGANINRTQLLEEDELAIQND